jgi:diaminohydroxyphosphoribosylaminopyrimidine deaminase / 5-amino-6-(5-phosphoribosylamino)uracil reductase
MRRALTLARRAMGFTSPNPMVGAVIVKRGKTLGEGYHHCCGMAHAEVEAIADAKKRGFNPSGATIYVTLEPCNHYGRTPPCTEAIIAAGIKTVVIGIADPNPCVDGTGILTLRVAGVRVLTGVLEKQCLDLNEPFFHKINTGKPLVILKAACSLDGKIATRTGHSQWISGAKALRYAHKLRAKYDAICVGLGTVLADDPQLTYRGSGKAAHPLRVILDSECRIPVESKVVSGGLPGKTLVATTSKAPKRKIRQLEKLGVEIAILPRKSGKIDMNALVDELGDRGINSLVIEGGSEVFWSSFEAGIVDQVRFVMAGMVIGGTDAKTVVGGLGVATIDDAPRIDKVRVTRLGSDLLISGWIHREELECLPD